MLANAKAKAQLSVGDQSGLPPLALNKYFQKANLNLSFSFLKNKLAKLQAMLVRNRNYDSLTESLTGVKCRATSVAKNGRKGAWDSICNSCDRLETPFIPQT